MSVAGQVVITVGQDGKVSVQCGGPAVPNQLVALGLIEVAKAALLSQSQQPASPLILPRTALPTNGHRG